MFLISAQRLQFATSEVIVMPLIPTDNITNLLQNFLGVQSKRTQVIAGNIANADTPGYTAKRLEFDDYLQEAVMQSSLPQSQQNQQLLTAEPTIVEETPTVIGIDGNTVDAGKEMSDLAQAGTDFNFGAKMLQSRFRLLRTAIREGK